MPRFRPGLTHSTTAASVVVDAGLPAGNHRFRLVVVDDSATESPPSEAVVTVGRVRVPIEPDPGGPVGPIPIDRRDGGG